MNWTCYATGQLEITGAGRLSAYSSSAAPWAVYADTVSSVFIGQGVTGVTGYAFADMRRVTAFSVAGDDYTVAEGVLYSGDGTELICYPGGRVATDFTIPNGVTAVYAAAFLSAWQLQQVESASAALTVTADGLLYGKNGRTLWMALPQFHQDTLVLRRAVLIAGGAFLLNHTLRTVYATAAVSVEPHGLGTAFSDGFVRRALTVYGLPGSVLETYCGTAIPFYPVNSGTCGAETAWQYDLDTTALTISGSGPVADFAADVAPWALFGAEIRQVTVEDGVTALPESSFANCTGLTQVTLGSGIEKMDANWFAHCPDLTELTVTATDTVFPAAVFAGVGDGLILYGYYDTSVMDYARQHGLTFVPLGCLHRIYTDSGPAPTCTANRQESPRRYSPWWYLRPLRRRPGYGRAAPQWSYLFGDGANGANLYSNRAFQLHLHRVRRQLHRRHPGFGSQLGAARLYGAHLLCGRPCAVLLCPLRYGGNKHFVAHPAGGAFCQGHGHGQGRCAAGKHLRIIGRHAGGGDQRERRVSV